MNLIYLGSVNALLQAFVFPQVLFYTKSINNICVNALLQAFVFPPNWRGAKEDYEYCVNALLQAFVFPRIGKYSIFFSEDVLMLFYKLLFFHSTLSKTLYLCGFASLFLQVFI